MIYELIKNGRMFYEHNSWNREDILRYSQEKFRNVLKYAYNSSIFYRELYNIKGIKEEDLNSIPINELPVIDKSMIIDNFYKISTKKLSEDKIIKVMDKSPMLPKIRNNYIVHTSGSTGKPTNFIYNKHALNILEANFVRLSLSGEKSIGLKDLPIKSLYIAPVGSGYACTALAIFGMKQYKCKSVIINAKNPLESWESMIKNYNPLYLSGYPSCINIICKLQEDGRINIKPKKVITGGEPVTQDEMMYYKKVFNADVIDYYGCTESICIGAASTFYEGMYLFDDINYVETDEKNRLIITPLYNKGFPLIRYQLTDIVEDFNKDYKGELPYTHIKRVVGRDEELMWFVNGNGKLDFLHPLFIDDLDVNGIKKYQFIQKSNNYFVLKCVKWSEEENNLVKGIKYQLDRFLKDKNLKNVKYNIQFVEDIPVNPHTGKSKLVIKEIGVRL